MVEVYICAYRRTAFGRFGGALAGVRPDDLGAIPIRALVEDCPAVDWEALDDVIFGNANQAGEDNRNVARMSALLAGLPVTVPGVTINRLCGSGMDAVLMAARSIRAGEADLILAGGTESMSRAPFVMGKAETAFSRQAEMHDTTIGWRFVNPLMRALHGVDSMPETAENLAEQFAISRADQDVFALGSQQKAAAAIASGRLAREIVPVVIPQRRGDPVIVDRDEHPRSTTLEALSRLATPFREAGGTVTAGNASGVNDGAAALLIASEQGMRRHGLRPVARIIGGATGGVAPRIMGYGPVPAIRKLLARTGLTLEDFDVLELNEAFAAQVLACSRAFGLSDDDPRINPHGGAIALGHPLGASGARIVGSTALELGLRGGGRALAAMCIGVGQGIALALEFVEGPKENRLSNSAE